MAETGCGKSNGSKKKEESAANNEAANKPLDMAVGMGAGNSRRTVTVTDDKTKEQVRRTLWEISWESASFAQVNELSSGQMFKVKGAAYVATKSKVGLEASTFVADQAEADQKENRLIIEGNVRVESKAEPKAVMSAKKVEWLPHLQLYKASGDVLIESSKGVVGPSSELYADAELKQFATSKDYIKIEKSADPKGPFKK